MGGNACLVWMLNTCEVVEVDDAVAALCWGTAINILASSCEQGPALPSTGAFRSLRSSCGMHSLPAVAASRADMESWVPAAQGGQQAPITEAQRSCLLHSLMPCNANVV